MSETDLEFFSRRESQERLAACAATSAEAARAHRILAEFYTLEVQRLGERLRHFAWPPTALTFDRLDHRA